jgi:hypothetical protein
MSAQSVPPAVPPSGRNLPVPIPASLSRRGKARLPRRGRLHRSSHQPQQRRPVHALRNHPAPGVSNKGQLFGDWIGHEGKGGQAWLAYHLSANEWVQAKDFVPGGTTQNLFTAQVVKRLAKDVELSASLQAEKWKAPLITSGSQSDVTTAVQITWYPKFASRKP